MLLAKKKILDYVGLYDKYIDIYPRVIECFRYLQEAEMREEGGTPAIVESIRAGLVFQLKDAIGTNVIKSRDEILCK